MRFLCVTIESRGYYSHFSMLKLICKFVCLFLCLFVCLFVSVLALIRANYFILYAADFVFS